MDKEMIKQKFYESNKLFFETGVLREIYATDEFSICNVSDQCYGVFPYFETQYGHGGVLVLTSYVEEISKNSDMFNFIVNSMSEKEFKSRVITLDDNMLKRLLELQKQNQITGPKSSIDYEMEERIMARLKK